MTVPIWTCIIIGIVAFIAGFVVAKNQGKDNDNDMPIEMNPLLWDMRQGYAVSSWIEDITMENMGETLLFHQQPWMQVSSMHT